MVSFNKKNIIVGVCGGIAAYKACYLVRELIKAGANVKVIMTPSACEFVTPLTFSTLSQNEVIVNIFPTEKKSNQKLSTWHIELGIWADLMIIAPATVNTIAKIAHGIADNALTTLVMSLRAPLCIAPAADVDMYEDEVNQENIEFLKSKGVFFVEPGIGELASGLSGKGRLAEIDDIIDKAEEILTEKHKDLKSKKILITSGPTYENIDPVRFIGNKSSGKMGHSLALAAFYRGADVTVITGPTIMKYPDNIKVINVYSADEMFNQVAKYFPKTDIFISAAAVADYKPKITSSQKIKRNKDIIAIELIKNRDILFEMSKKKKKNQKLIGFALETDNDLENAKLKLKNKNLDLIVLNNPMKEGSGFNTDTNQVTLIDADGNIKEFGLLSKFQVANNIFNYLLYK